MRVTKCSLIALCLVSVALSARGQQPGATHLSAPTGTRQAQQPVQQTPPATKPATASPGSFADVEEQVMRMNYQPRTETDFNELQLPPLEVLFESARNNPRVEYYSYRRVEEESVMKGVKKQWLRYISLNTAYQYGLMGMTTNVENDPTLPAYYTYSDQAQSWWSIGASISMPLEEFFTRRDRIRAQQARINQTEYETETWYNEQKLAIIESYTNAMMNLALISSKSEAATLATRQYQMSQGEFINGKMDIAELSRMKGIQTAAIAEYETAKSQLYQSILRLETLSNYKILNR